MNCFLYFFLGVRLLLDSKVVKWNSPCMSSVRAKNSSKSCWSRWGWQIVTRWVFRWLAISSRDITNAHWSWAPCNLFQSRKKRPPGAGVEALQQWHLIRFKEHYKYSIWILNHDQIQDPHGSNDTRRDTTNCTCRSGQLSKSLRSYISVFI